MSTILVFQEENGLFRAELAGGWWMAKSKTVKQAIASVKKRHKDEREYFGEEDYEERNYQIELLSVE